MARQGATPAVLRAMGLSNPRDPVRIETAACESCRFPLEFSTGEFGQSIERCTNRRCDGREWHPLVRGLLP